MAVFSGRLLPFFHVVPNAKTFVKTLSEVHIVMPHKSSTRVRVETVSLVAEVEEEVERKTLVREVIPHRHVQPAPHRTVVLGVFRKTAAVATFLDAL